MVGHFGLIVKVENFIATPFFSIEIITYVTDLSATIPKFLCHVLVSVSNMSSMISGT